MMTTIATLTASAAFADEVNTIDFNREIRPLLSDRCISCHGPDKAHREADLRLDDFADLTKHRDGHQVVSPGNAGKSLLMQRIRHEDQALRMPPIDSGKSLDLQEIELLEYWINLGAPWKAHWAYEPPVDNVAPFHDLTDWRRNWIDDYIAGKLCLQKLKPSKDADPSTLLRRLHFDLTGLPPSASIIKRIGTSLDAEVWETLVDELTASDAYAERMAMFWLDLVRYADTVGYHGDQDHNISPYRDWVIDAFAAGMPFDQFTREQIAGDLLPNSTIDQQIATGYNRLLQTTHEGGLQPKEYLAIYAADRVRNISSVWMGATLGCAQCHDHKFDPYSTKDFYSMAAFFADIDEADHFKTGSNSLPTKRAPEIKVFTKRERERLDSLQAQLRDIEEEIKHSPPDTTVLEKRKQLAFAIDDLQASMRLTMITAALPKPRITRILPRGNWMDDSGLIVQPAIPEFMGKLSSEQRATRLDLANWLVDAEFGVGLLTARVMVNRLWNIMFGSGLSTSLDDFGGQGSAPDHPELLDRLAIEFVSSGWDIRHVMRLIAKSRTYQQSSDLRSDLQPVDPGNRLFARQASFRLPAEMIRDNALKISGLLVAHTGGSSVRPYQPNGYYRHLNFPVRTYAHHADERQWRRGVYVHWQRQFLHPMLRAFDAPSREECTAQRPRSNTPLAALALLNDPTFVEAARVFAARILSTEELSSDDDRIRFAFRETLSRYPDVVELRELRTLLSNGRKTYLTNHNDSVDLTSVGISPVADLPASELAAWTFVARALLNLDETITRY